jgi:hypothetical protein
MANLDDFSQTNEKVFARTIEYLEAYEHHSPGHKQREAL